MPAPVRETAPKAKATTRVVKATTRTTVIMPARPVRSFHDTAVAAAIEVRQFGERVRNTYEDVKAVFIQPDSVPYLLTVPPPSIAIVGEPLFRKPPLLPKIVVIPPAPPASAAPTPSLSPSTEPTLPGGPDEATPSEQGKHTPMDEAVDFFRDSGDRSGNQKGLGDSFDPTFAPAVVPVQPTSSATYRRE